MVYQVQPKQKVENDPVIFRKPDIRDPEKKCILEAVQKECFMTHRFARVLWILTALCLAGCATPIPPTGGPPDRTGPVIVETTPQTGTTNFDGDEVRITFDKFVNRANFIQNVSIEPDLAIDFEVSFRRRTAIVSFEDPLPDNTTVVIRLGVEITDTNNNRMASSFDLALSTGDELDDGVVTALLLDAETGRGESGKRVFLYREPADLSERATYVAQSDTAGIVEFGYLSEGTYRAFWVDDVNRNRQWDRDRERAQPFMDESFELDRGSTMDLGTLYYSMPDTVAPRIDGVGLLSERRLRLRLSEPIEWTPDAVLALTDTVGNLFTEAHPLYSSESDPNVFFAQSDDALPEDHFFMIDPDGFTDAAGNPLISDVSPFEGSSEPDTTGLRTISHNSGSGLFPDEALEIKYSKFIDDRSVVDSLLVFEGDQQFSDWPAVEVDRHILRILPRDERWESGLRYEFRVWDPWESEHLRINPDFWQRNQLGGIEFEFENDDPDVEKVLRLTDRDHSILVDTTFTGSEMTIENLPPLEYRAIVFEDRNGNGVWDAGEIDPYVQPEPYAIRRAIPVREGFTSEVSLSFPQTAREVDEDEIEDEPEESGDINPEQNGEPNREP